MRRRYIFATAVVFAVAIALVSITIYTIPPKVIAAEPQTITSSLQNANSSTASAMSLSLKTIFKQVENSVVQITSKKSEFIRC
jgi:hypothetical protein